MSGAPRARADENGLALRLAQQRVFQHALDKISHSVVRIDTIGGALPTREIEGEEGEKIAVAAFRQSDGPTTGIVWSDDGYILSSNINFMRNPSVIMVRLADGRRFVGKLVARDATTRLALVKIDARNLDVPTLAPAEDIQPGQWALAAGFGHGSRVPAVTTGIVSAKSRANGLALQTDAKISPANYGGPLFDIEGRLLGLCVPIAGEGESVLAGVQWYDSGIGFAVRNEVMAARFERLKEGADLRPGSLGVVFDGRDPVVGEPDDPGVRIVDVAEGPARVAGMAADDFVVKIAGVGVERVAEIKQVLTRFSAGDAVPVVIRNGAGEREVEVRLVPAAEIPVAAPPEGTLQLPVPMDK
ncbi:MAG: S1C family serine protease [Phycisphaerae bacterium]